MKKTIAALALCLFSCAYGVKDKVDDPQVLPPASHAWSNFHWGTGGPVQVTLSRNLSPVWQPYLTVASADWSRSSVIDTLVVQGNTEPQACKPTPGQVEVCNGKYGKNGWLGHAVVWVDNKGGITQATVQLNDTYFETPGYTTADWRLYVTCHEVGHVLGLYHRDEKFDNLNLGSCLDYTNNPAATPQNTHPDALDFEVLETIYNGVSARDAVVVSINDLVGEERVITHIFPVPR